MFKGINLNTSFFNRKIKLYYRGYKINRPVGYSIFVVSIKKYIHPPPPPPPPSTTARYFRSAVSSSPLSVQVV
jgi:hypothetical protein